MSTSNKRVFESTESNVKCGIPKRKYYNKSGVNRLVFKLDETKGDICAAGIIPYLRYIGTDGRYHLMYLVTQYDNMIEFLGGKTEEKDSCIEDTARRELSEETNHVLDDWVNSLPENISNFRLYFPRSKFLAYFVPINKHFIMPSSAFGIVEKFNGIKRRIEWMSMDEIEKWHIKKYDKRQLLKYMAGLEVFENLSMLKKE